MNVQLRQVYRHKNSSPDTIYTHADGKSGTVQKIGKDTQLKALEKRKDWWRVQTYSGDIGWIPSKSVQSSQAKTKQ